MRLNLYYIIYGSLIIVALFGIVKAIIKTIGVKSQKEFFQVWRKITWKNFGLYIITYFILGILVFSGSIFFWIGIFYAVLFFLLFAMIGLLVAAIINKISNRKDIT